MKDAEQRFIVQRERIIAFMSVLVDKLVNKNIEYNESWKKRGGTDSFFMLARKWDRIEEQVKRHGWNILEALKQDQREEGLIDDIMDLMGYLMLVVDEDSKTACGRHDGLTFPDHPVVPNRDTLFIETLPDGSLGPVTDANGNPVDTAKGFVMGRLHSDPLDSSDVTGAAATGAAVGVVDHNAQDYSSELPSGVTPDDDELHVVGEGELYHGKSVVVRVNIKGHLTPVAASVTGWYTPEKHEGKPVQVHVMRQYGGHLIKDTFEIGDLRAYHPKARE